MRLKEASTNGTTGPNLPDYRYEALNNLWARGLKYSEIVHNRMSQHQTQIWCAADAKSHKCEAVLA